MLILNLNFYDTPKMKKNLNFKFTHQTMVLERLTLQTNKKTELIKLIKQKCMDSLNISRVLEKLKLLPLFLQ